jgi:3-phosphoglycerate kinase
MKLQKQTVNQVPIERKTVLVRADYNVPLGADGSIRDDLRIRASLPTLKYLMQHDCKVVVISHLGRPDGRPSRKESLKPVAARLSELLGAPVSFVNDCIGERVSHTVQKTGPGEVVLLENLRFYHEEEANDESFAKALVTATKARYLVQDGFGVVHRAHASTSAITRFIPAVAGLLLQREIETISTAMRTPKRPLVAILGGAKVSDKIGVIEAFVHKADKILIGGAMANTFLAYKQKPVGSSKYETNQDEVMARIYQAASDKVGVNKVDEFIILPQDVAVGSSIDAQKRHTVQLDDVKKNDRILDIGDHTITQFCDEVAKAGTVIWNGTLGFAENKTFSHGSARVALALATHPSVVSIIGGGDTSDFVLSWGSGDGSEFTHVSTGGGASLELMAGKKLPGIEALLDAQK